MIGAASNLFSGRMLISGVAVDGARQDSPLASCLRIDGQKPAAAPEIAESAKAESSAAQESEAKQTTIENFTSTLLSRLQSEQLKKTDGNDIKSLEESEALAESVARAIKEIKNEFGQSAANQVMAAILTGTEKGVTGSNIAGAVSETMKAIASENNAVLNDPDVTADAFEAATKMEEKLKKFIDFLNQKADDDNQMGLTQALNGYFEKAAAPDGDLKSFTSDFSWLSAKEVKARETAEGGAGGDLSLSVKELGREHVADLANFLRDALGDEEAANYIEGLGDDEDIFTAVDKVRGMFYEDSYDVRPGRDPVSGELGIAYRGGPGMQKIAKLNEYLNFNMVDAANQAFRSTPELTNRLKNYVSMYFDGDASKVPDDVGMTAWRGGNLCVSGGSTEGQFYFASVGDSTAEDRNAGFLATAGDFWRTVSQNTSEKNRAQYEQFAANCDKNYLDYLLGGGKTEPGSMLNRAV